MSKAKSTGVKYYKKGSKTKSGGGGSGGGGGGGMEYNGYATYLVIVESPSKCKKIEDYLGDTYQCIASKGHIREIDGLKAIQTKDKYQITFSPIDNKRGHIQKMREMIAHFAKPNIYLATDDDREGEAIAWHICDVFGLPIETTKRILFHEITKPAITAAIQTPTTVNMSMVYAQQSRQVLDIIVGYKISPLLWKYIHNNKTNGLSAGRCQTPALRLIYENEQLNQKEITIQYKIRGYFFSSNACFQLVCRRRNAGGVPPPQDVGPPAEFDTEEAIQRFFRASIPHKYNLYMGETKPVLKSPPKPFTTSSLLQHVSNVYHYSPKTTMDLCQQLYQMGLITYMRTDSTKYSPVFLETAKTYIQREYDPLLSVSDKSYVGNLAAIQNKDGANPHEAIRITNIHMKHINENDTMLCNMYRTIWRNTVESCMAVAIYEATDIVLTAAEDYLFHKTVEIPKYLGWKVVASTDTKTEEINALKGELFKYQSMASATNNPSFAITHNYLESHIIAHNKQSHYTESSLIQKLEDLGIGRPSTYASIVSTIQERGYVVRKNLEGQKFQCNEWTLREAQLTKVSSEKVFGNEQNKLVIQPIGIITTEFLIQHFHSLFDYSYTGNMEKQLDEIATAEAECAEKEWYLPCKSCSEEIKALIKPLAKLTKQTYPIDDEYSLIFTQYGASLSKVGENGEVIYKPVKKSMVIQLEKLKNKEYTALELLEIPEDCLGLYQNEPVYLKTGKFGAYISYKESNLSIKHLKKEIAQIKLEDIIPFILHHNLSQVGATGGTTASNPSSEDLEAIAAAAAANPLPLPPSVLRELTPHLSVRKGKFGPYIYYKTPHMGSPKFFNLKPFKHNFRTCKTDVLLEWIQQTYSVS